MKRRRILLGGSGPSPGFITQHPVPNTITYDGQEHELCTAGSGSGTMLYSKDGVSFSSSIPTEINAGTYTVYYKTDSSHSYTESDVYQISCTIDKAAGSVSIAPTNKSVTYNGTAQDIVNAGSGTGTMYYRVGDSGDFSTTIPKQTNASSSYTVYYYAAESSNYALSSTSSVTATIGLKEVTLTWGTVTWTYDGNTHSTTCTAGNVYSGDSCTVTLTGNSVGPNAGTATVTASSLSNSNYALPSSKTATLTINKAAGSVSISGVSLTYNGNSRSLVSVSGNTGTMHYSTDYSNWSTSISATNAGSWTIYWYMDASTNYNSIDASTSRYVSSSIGKADLSAPTAYGASTTYPTTATASASGGGGVGSIEWSNGNTQTSVGSKTTYARWSGNSNYNASGWSNGVTVAMNKADQSAPTAYGATVSYGSTAYASASGGGGVGSIEWSNGSSRSALGSQLTYARWTGNSNYHASGWSNGVYLTVVKADQSAPTAYGSTTTYPTTATASASGGGGAGSIEWESAQSLSSVGSHTTRARWTGNDYYNASAWSGYVTVLMNKAAGSVSTAPTAKNPGYTGSPVALVNAGSGTGTMYYSLNSSSGFSTSIPTATNVGSYTVYYYAAASTNYNLSSTGSVTSTIGYAEGWVTNTKSISVNLNRWSSGQNVTIPGALWYCWVASETPRPSSSYECGFKNITFVSGTNVCPYGLYLSFGNNSLIMASYQGYYYPYTMLTSVLLIDGGMGPSGRPVGTGVYTADLQFGGGTGHNGICKFTITITVT